MAKMIQIRNVPEDVHRELKAKAAKTGMSLSAFLLREAERLARELTWEEFIERAATLPPVEVPPGTVEEIIRRHRDA